MKKATESELRRSLEELVLLATPFAGKQFGAWVRLTNNDDWIAFRSAVHRSTQLLDQKTPE